MVWNEGDICDKLLGYIMVMFVEICAYVPRFYLLFFLNLLILKIYYT